MADQPQPPEKKAQPSPDFGVVLGGTSQGPRADMSDPARRLQTPAPEAAKPAQPLRPGETPRPEVPIPAQAVPNAADRPDLKFSGRALELSFADKDFDKKLAYAAQYNSRDFNTIKLNDLPPGNEIHTWVDSNGYFIYLKNQAGQASQKHYIPRNVDTLSLSPSDNLDMRAERGRITVAYNQDVTTKMNDFYKTEMKSDPFNLDQRSTANRDGGNASMNFARRMSGMSGEKLAAMETYLREAVKTTGSPYAKMWLGDIYFGQAFQYVAERAITDHPVPVNNPYTMGKLNDAIALEDASVKDADNTLGGRGMKRNYNTFEAARPDSPYWDPDRNPGGYLMYYGSVGNQALYKKESYSAVKALIETGVVPKLELPPYRAPRLRGQ